MVHNQPSVYASACRSLIEIGWGSRIVEAKAAYGIDEIAFQWQCHGARVDTMRNQTAADAIAFGATHVLFLDADMTFPHDLLLRMLRHVTAPNLIVGGLYTLKHPPFAPVALVNERDMNGVWWFDHLDLRKADAGDIRDVDVIGMGCTLVPTEAFRAVPRPWFHYRNDADGEARVSEDVPFCQNARAAGFGVQVDTSVICKHLSVEEHDIEWHYEYQKHVEELMEHSPVVVTRR